MTFRNLKGPSTAGEHFLPSKSMCHSGKELTWARTLSLAAYKLCAIASWGLRIAEIHLFMHEAFIPKVLDIAYQER